MEEETWIARELRKRREKGRGISGREFARQIGCSPSHAHRLITGAERPSPKLCRRIAPVFGMTEQEAMREAGHLSDLPENYDKAQEHELRDIMRGLTHSDRKMLIEFAQFLFRRDDDSSRTEGEGA